MHYYSDQLFLIVAGLNDLAKFLSFWFVHRLGVAIGSTIGVVISEDFFSLIIGASVGGGIGALAAVVIAHEWIGDGM